jgi:hypothetical protein
MKDESYTPDWVVKAVKHVLMSIELDPTSNHFVKLGVHNYTQHDNCFVQDWSKHLTDHKTVYMNPPFSQGGLFLSELHKYLTNGAIDYAITLTLPGLLHNKKSSWMFSSKFCKSLAFPIGRINFENNGNSNDRDALFTFWSNNDDKTDQFNSVFRDLKSPLLNRVHRVNGSLITQPMHSKVEPETQTSIIFT